MSHDRQSVQVPQAWRGKCPCGRWLVVLISFEKERPLRCECGRRWYIQGDAVVCEPGRVVPALCVDLDGTVRRSKSGTFISGPSDIELFPEAEAKLYRDGGFLIIGVSNQGGVAFGHKTELCQQAELDATCRAFARNPFHIIKACYHHEGGSVYCHRSLLRKPSYGMLAIAEAHAFAHGFVIDWDKSLLVGDREEDEGCAKAAGIAFRWADEFFGRSARVAP